MPLLTVTFLPFCFLSVYLCWMEFNTWGATDNIKSVCKCHSLMLRCSQHNGLGKSSDCNIFLAGTAIKLIYIHTYTQWQSNISGKIGGAVLSTTPLFFLFFFDILFYYFFVETCFKSSLYLFIFFLNFKIFNSYMHFNYSFKVEQH